MATNGTARIFKIGFLHSPVYLLDAAKPEAVHWYVGLCHKWLNYGVDGFKEDLFSYASVNPSMAMGFSPWNFKDAQVERVMLAAAKLHAKLQPYIYSTAVDTFESGFPCTITPLPLAWPDDKETFHLGNAQRRGYEWMLGPFPFKLMQQLKLSIFPSLPAITTASCYKRRNPFRKGASGIP